MTTMSSASARERIRQLSPERRALLEAMRQEKLAAAGPPPILPRPPGTALLPASFAQQRLWFLDQLEPGLAAYNIAAVLRLTGPLAPGLLAASLGEVVARHEALRTTFTAVGGQPRQEIAPPSPLALPLVDVS